LNTKMALPRVWVRVRVRVRVRIRVGLTGGNVPGVDDFNLD
jgi:hypothetical protein